MSGAQDRPVFTVGHSNHEEGEFLRLVRAHGIEAVADVRSQPYSRYQPQFNRETLARTLANAGIAYVFLGQELGARPDDRSVWDGARVNWARLEGSALFQQGLDRVEQGRAKMRIALMCAEEEPLVCHRTLLVARALVARGVPVVHIRAGSTKASAGERHTESFSETYEHAVLRLLREEGLPDLSQPHMFQSDAERIAEAIAARSGKVVYEEERFRAGEPEDAP